MWHMYALRYGMLFGFQFEVLIVIQIAVGLRGHFSLFLQKILWNYNVQGSSMLFRQISNVMEFGYRFRFNGLHFQPNFII